MGETNESSPVVRYYYVDEAGDPSLFARRGKSSLVGKEGCSTFFMLGVLDVGDPILLASDLVQLRQSLLQDATLSGVPSMALERRKTAELFHARDDCAEVRREVFRTLMSHRLKFFAVVRDKRCIVDAVLRHNETHPQYRYHPNQLYDRCVSRLFKERLHKDAGYVVHFARRGSKDRTEALRTALEQAKRNLQRSWGITSTAPVDINPCNPRDEAGLQAVDYFLWALQRLYERSEDRYWNFVSPAVSLVHDVDDTRENEYGVYYGRSNRLTLAVKKEK